MQIQKVQTNQTTFGTKVKLSSVVANIIAESKSKNSILKQIQQLEQNGKDDVFILTGDNFAKKAGNTSVAWGEVVTFFKGKRNEQPYMTKTRGQVDIESLKESYEEMINPNYQVWKPKKIKLAKGIEKLFQYMI